MIPTAIQFAAEMWRFSTDIVPVPEAIAGQSPTEAGERADRVVLRTSNSFWRHLR